MPFRQAHRLKHSQRGGSAEKRRKTTCRPPDLCSSAIKIFRFFSSGMIKVERHRASPDHTHSLRESDQIKRPELIRALIETDSIFKAVKEHATNRLGLGEALHALRTKEAYNIKTKVRGRCRPIS